jgi:hypothetical protein
LESRWRPFAERERILALANGQHQAAVYGLPDFAEAGGLMSYSFSLIEQYGAAATFIDKILGGATLLRCRLSSRHASS